MALGNSDIVRSYLISLLFMLVLPLILGAALYSRIESSYEGELRSALNDELSYIVEAFDKDIVKTRILAQTIMEQDEIRKILSIRTDFQEGGNPLIVLKARQALESYKVNNERLEAIWLYYKDQDLLVTHNTVVSDLSQSYLLGDISFGTLSYHALREDILLNSQVDGHLMEKSVIQDVSYRENIIPYTAGSPGMKILLFLKERALDTLFSLLTNHGDLFYGIFHPDGRIIFTNDRERALDLGAQLTWDSDRTSRMDDFFEDQYSFTLVRYSDFGYGFIVAIPFDVLLRELSPIRRTALILFALLLVLGIATAFVLSRRQGKPVADIILDLRRHMPVSVAEGTGSYEFIQACLNELYSSRRIPEDLGTTQRVLIRRFLYKLLLSGDLDPSLGDEEIYANTPIPPGASYAVVLCRRAGRKGLPYEAVENEADFLSPPIGDYTLLPLFRQKNGDDQYILCRPNNDEKAQDPDTTLLKSRLADYYRIEGKTLLVGIGAFRDRVRELQESARQAGQVLSYMEFHQEATVKHYHEIPDRLDEYHCPREWINRLIDLIMSGKIDETSTLFSDIRRENFEHRCLSPSSRRMLYNDLGISLYQLCRSLGLETMEPWSWETYADGSEPLIRIKEEYLRLAAMMSARNRERHPLVERIEAYVSEKVSDSQLSVTSLSQTLHYSENYLSSLYKKETGRTIGSYVRDERMKLAKALLSKGKIPSSAIHKKIGYSSYRNFRRVFKQVTGLLPNEYRVMKAE